VAAVCGWAARGTVAVQWVVVDPGAAAVAGVLAASVEDHLEAAARPGVGEMRADRSKG
jgi:hypothetical protein